jgi:hypothetical protein
MEKKFTSVHSASYLYNLLLVCVSTTVSWTVEEARKREDEDEGEESEEAEESGDP